MVSLLHTYCSQGKIWHQKYFVEGSTWWKLIPQIIKFCITNKSNKLCLVVYHFLICICDSACYAATLQRSKEQVCDIFWSKWPITIPSLMTSITSIQAAITYHTIALGQLLHHKHYIFANILMWNISFRFHFLILFIDKLWHENLKCKYF